ncbi:zinc-binding dehydrogenase [Acrocarpospora macrocephala]|uniref:Oxidoreductase n=2 Tax=Acrocarpospora macrocephala TaxID=150177 RepID=A0A5M3WRU7_9ACTN|nr:oxidoreductase [Acrocarpospora macrocephala]
MIRAVVSDPAIPGGLRIEEVPPPRPGAGDAVVAVSAFSLNAGEVRESLAPARRWRPGWDLAGVVASAAADGSGPAAGARVVGFAGLGGGGWAQRVAVRTADLAVVPDEVSLVQAACLPVAGLTALFALARGGLLLGRSVLVTGASGGVGRLACQLAAAAGATVYASVRGPEQAATLDADAVHEVVLADHPLPRRFDLILESVGGDSLARSLAGLEVDGTCVLYGNAAERATTFQPRDFYQRGAATLYGFFLGTELRDRSAGAGLDRLLGLVRDGRLTMPVETEASWRELPGIARRYHDRELAGKVVLTVDQDG